MRPRVGKSLRQTEQKYRRIFEDSKDMVYTTSADGKHADVNQAGVDLLGYGSKEKMMQVYARDTFLYPEDQKRFMNEVIKEGFVKDFEVKLKRRDGAPIDVLITANARRDDSGKIISYEGIIKDISDRKRMEEELVQRTRELEALNDINKILASSRDVKQVIQAVHAELKRVFDSDQMTIMLLDGGGEGFQYFGLEEDDETKGLEEDVIFPREGTVSGKVVGTGVPVIVQDIAQCDSRIDQKLILEGMRSSLIFPLEYKGKVFGTMNFGSKEIKHFSERRFPLLRQVAAALSSSIENSLLLNEMRESEEKYRTVVESAMDGVCVIDRDYRFKYVNERLAEIQGYSREELIGTDLRNYLDEESKAVLADREEQEKRGMKLSPHFELKILRKDGKVRNAEISAGSIKDLRGDVNIIVFLRDITDRKHAEEALRQSEETARRLSQENATMAEIGQIISSTLNIEEVYEPFAEEVQKLIPFDRIVINTINIEKATVMNVYMAGKGIVGRKIKEVYPLEGSGNAEMVRTKSTILIQTEDFNEYKDRFPMLLSTFQAGFRSIMNVPLFSKGQLIGGLLLRSFKPYVYTDKDVRLAEKVGNQIAGAIANAQLFSERKRTEEALRENEKRLQSLMDASPIGITWADMEGNIKYSNRKYRQLFGYTVDDIPTIAEWRRLAYPDPAYRETVPPLVAMLTEAQKQGREVRPIEVTVTCKDGSTRCVEQMGAFASNQILAIYNDLTERKRMEEALRQSEEKYRTMLENMQEGYLEVDLAGNFTFVNNAQCSNLGYTREELMGMSYQRYTDEKNGRELYQAFNGVYKTGEPVKVLDVEVIRKDGTKVFSEISVSLIRDSEGKPIGFRGISRDMTERKRMEEQLLQAEKLRAVGEMASGVAHDFNNALAAILGNTQLMLYSVRDEEFKESLQTIEKVAKDSAQTVRRLQDFTRRKVHQEQYKLDVNSIVKDAIGITKPKWKDEAQGKGIRIEMVSHCEEIPPVAGSASELREVMTNLVFNAVEAMPEGGRIEIRTFQKDGKVCIQISDTGIGIKEEVRKKIFEPFFTTKPFSNTGLGLSMVYGVIKRMRGDIDVESEVGKGTTFTIFLPICFEAMEEATSLPSSPPVIQKKKGVRILVIDDEESVRSVLSRILTRLKYQVNVAKDGEEGIRLFSEQAFDMVLTDLGMPGMSGWDVCRAIKKMNPQTPVGMITGWGMEVGEERMKEVELDFLISKPFDSNEILHTVAKTIESKTM
jgi:PAS domain S-box-containing protein